MFPSQVTNVFLTYQTFVTNLHLLGAELSCKLQEKLHCVTEPSHNSSKSVNKQSHNSSKSVNKPSVSCVRTSRPNLKESLAGILETCCNEIVTKLTTQGVPTSNRLGRNIKLVLTTLIQTC